MLKNIIKGLITQNLCFQHFIRINKVLQKQIKVICEVILSCYKLDYKTSAQKDIRMPQETKMRFQQSRKTFQERFDQNLVKIDFNNEQNILQFLKNLNKILSSQKRRAIFQSFQTLRINSNKTRNKQLIYAAINRKDNTPKKHQTIGRKIRKQTKTQTIKKQSQQFFQFINDDISTLKNETNNDSITLQSRIDLDFFQQLGMKRQNNFISRNQIIRNQARQKEKGNFNIYKQTNKSQDYNLQTDSHQSYCKNLGFQKYDENKEMKKIYPLNKTFFIQTKFKKQSLNQNFEQIFIFREPPNKGKRYSSMPLNQKHKFIQIPLKSQKIKVFQYSTNSKKNSKSQQSLQTKNSTNACFENCENSPLIEKCKYCSMIQKANEIIKKLKSS